MTSWTSARSLEDLGISRSAIATGAALFATGFVVRGFLNNRLRRSIIPSPRSHLLANLTKNELAKLPYPLDALPGARDVQSPAGSIRVYEFGPEDGRKVLLIHGVSTPCLVLGAVAHGLADKGCRVMLFDLFGRGYSDNPAHLPHDMVLFTSQILLVLATSPLSWTGSSSGRFSIVGYSLGGGIATAFTSHFPTLVASLVTIAPSGLLRPRHIGRSSRLIYSEGIIPESVLNFFVHRRLKTPLYPTKPKSEKEYPNVTDTVNAEIPNLESSPLVPLSKSHPDIRIENAVSWQVDHHDGFVPAFMSSIRHGPITEQHDDWRVIGRRLTQQAAGCAKGSPDQGLEHAKVLIITGNDDVIIKKDELVADATAALDGNVVFKFIDAGHEAPVVKSQDVVRAISEFWNL